MNFACIAIAGILWFLSFWRSLRNFSLLLVVCTRFYHADLDGLTLLKKSKIDDLLSLEEPGCSVL